jgi:hypothetical protein
VIYRWGLPTRLALTAAALSLIVATLAGFGAWRLSPLPGAVAPAGFELDVASPASEETAASDSLIRLAVSRDPFRPDRRPPAQRYQMPGERTTAARISLPQAMARARLTGTVILGPRAGLAAIEVPGRGPRVLAVGDEFEGYRLTRVERGAATLVGPDTTIVLTLLDSDRGR